MSNIIKWMVLVLLFLFAGIGISVCGVCVGGFGGDSDPRGGCG